jgi:hypothetical protein
MPEQAVRRRFQPVVDRIQRAQRRQGGPVPEDLAALRLGCDDRAGLGHQRDQVRRRPGRDEQRQDDACQGGVQTAGMHARPQRGAEQHVRHHPVDVGAVQQRERARDRERQSEIAGLQIA